MHRIVLRHHLHLETGGFDGIKKSFPKKTAENIGIRTIFYMQSGLLGFFRGFKLMELLAALRLESPGRWFRNYSIKHIPVTFKMDQLIGKLVVWVSGLEFESGAPK